MTYLLKMCYNYTMEENENIPNYPTTPMKNCLYCFHYNDNSNSCTAPKAHLIANFNPNETRDCILLKYQKTENPNSPVKEFAEQFCIGKSCPYFYASKRLCTRPSLCPYKGQEPTIFQTIKLKKL